MPWFQSQLIFSQITPAVSYPSPAKILLVHLQPWLQVQHPQAFRLWFGPSHFILYHSPMGFSCSGIQSLSQVSPLCGFIPLNLHRHRSSCEGVLAHFFFQLTPIHPSKHSFNFTSSRITLWCSCCFCVEQLSHVFVCNWGLYICLNYALNT